MESNYVIILDFCGGWLNIIHLTKEEVEASEKYDDFEEFLLLVSAKTFKPYLAFNFPRTADILNV